MLKKTPKLVCLIPIVQDKIYSGRGKESKVNCSCYCRWSGWQVKFILAVKSPIFCPLSPRCTNDPIWSFAAPIITSFLVSVRKKWWWGGRLLEGGCLWRSSPCTELPAYCSMGENSVGTYLICVRDNLQVIWKFCFSLKAMSLGSTGSTKF